jgi:hypothetical protein
MMSMMGLLSTTLRVTLTLAAMLVVVSVSAQVPAEVRTDVQVLEVDRNSLRSLGVLPLPTQTAPAKPLSLSVNVTEKLASSLAVAQGSRTLQSFQLTTVGESAAQFRVASRVVADRASVNLPAQTLDAGVDFQFVAKVSLKREISMQIVSQVRIRRGEDAGGDSPLFSGQAMTQKINTAEGASVLIGGFVTEDDSRRLSKIEPLQRSPLLNYVFSTEGADEPDIVLLLTPHIVRPPSGGEAVGAVSIARAVRTVRSSEPAQYTVQVGAFKSEDHARALQMELSRRYADVSLQPISSGQKLFRVRVGRVADLQAATQLQKQLTADGFETIIFRSK